LSGSWWAEGAWLTTAWLCSWSWLMSMCPIAGHAAATG
jgi:hypothetical protein